MAPKKILPAIKKREAGIHRFFCATNSATLDDLNNTLSEVLTITPTSITASNLTVYGGGINTENGGFFQNRLLNGDMRVDQRGTVTGTPGVGVGAGGSAAAASTVYSVDRWAIANGSASGTLCAAQVALTASDQAAVEGRFNNAAVISISPISGLSAYMPFNNSLLDASGNGNTPTLTGSVSYVPGRVSGTAVYLANEANVLATSTAAANYLLNTSYSFASYFTVSLWFLCSKIPPGASYPSVIFSTNSGGNTLIIYMNTTPVILFGITGIAGYTGAAIAVNTWAHVAIVNKNGALSFYVNGVQTSTTTTAFGNIGYKLGDRPGTINPFAGYIDEFRIYNRALSATEIAALANVAPPTVAPTTSLITRLTFDNVTTDSQGTLPAPVATGTTVYSSSSKSGTASLDLTGNTAGGTMTVGQTYTLASGSFSLPLSMGGWINASSPSTGTQDPICIGNNSVSSAPSIQFQMYLTAILVSAHIGGTHYISPLSPFTLTAGAWYYCFLTVTNSYLQFYINGVMVSSTKTGSGVLTINNSGTGSPTQLRIGGQTGSGLILAFKGLVDDVRIYNRELSASEVAGLYYSYQNAAYILYQQPIEGLNVADLAWGTTAAQSATVSAWIKNNTTTAQQFSLSAGNTGVLPAIAAITFETNLGINDTLGFLTNPVGTNVVYSTSIYKVGTRSLDLTANTISAPVNTFISYNYNYSKLPLSVSLWIYPTSAAAQGNAMLPFSIGDLIGNSFNILITGGSQIYTIISISDVTYTSSRINLTLSQWLHVSITLTTGGDMILYLNGIAVTVNALPSTALELTVGSTTQSPSILKLGCRCFDNGNVYKGYIDDVRIFKKALSAAEVYQIYSLNVSSTTVSQYLLSRYYLYTTPNIPSGAWQKISFTIPGDTTDAAWAKDTTCGINLALCLGASAPYVGANVTSGWSSAQYFTGSNIQAYGASANNFLADTSNSIYLTGVQFEKGTIATPFSARPYSTELKLCQRYYETISVVDQGGSQTGTQWTSSTYKVIKRAIPTLSYTTLYGTLEPTLTYVDSFRFTRSAAEPAVYGLRLDAEL